MSIKGRIALGSAAAGITCLAAAVSQGLAYNEMTDPGALNAMVDFGIAAFAFLLVPVLVIAAWIVREARREIARSGFTPRQVAIGEAILMAGAGYEWHEYNKRVSEQLTASVMGPERGAEEPWG
jgi:hypothetical protein